MKFSGTLKRLFIVIGKSLASLIKEKLNYVTVDEVIKSYISFMKRLYLI